MGFSLSYYFQLWFFEVDSSEEDLSKFPKKRVNFNNTDVINWQWFLYNYKTYIV